MTLIIRIVIFLSLIPSVCFGSSFQYIDKIVLSNTLGDPSSYGNNLLFIQNDFPGSDNVVVLNTSGTIINGYPAKGSFTAGVTYNNIRNRILFSGDNNYSGNIYEIDPTNGSVSGIVAQTGYSQPFLAFDGSSILASGAASGSNGILSIPIKKLDPLTYNDLGTVMVTVNTGTTASGVSRSIIAADNTYLYVSLGIGGLQDVYEFDRNLNLLQTIKITQILSGQGIGGLAIINNDLYIHNTSTDELYHYRRQSPVGSSGGGGGGGGCSISSAKTDNVYSALASIVLLFLPNTLFLYNIIRRKDFSIST